MTEYAKCKNCGWDGFVCPECGEGEVFPLPASGGPAVDRQVIEETVTYFRAQQEGCEQLRAANEQTGADLTAIDYHARAETWQSAAAALVAALTGLPETMFRTRGFDDSTDEQLTPVAMKPIDEAAEDEWYADQPAALTEQPKEDERHAGH